MLRMTLAFVLSLAIVAQLGCGNPQTIRPSGSPRPNISLAPNSAVAGSSSLLLTITGSGFTFANFSHTLNQVVWSASGVDTVLIGSFVSSTQLTVTVDMTLLVSPVHARVRVEIWDVQGDAPEAVSNSVPFVVTAASAIVWLSPGSAATGSSDLQLTIGESCFSNANGYSSAAVWSVNELPIRPRSPESTRSQEMSSIDSYIRPLTIDYRGA
jgi:hypothetical protein